MSDSQSKYETPFINTDKKNNQGYSNDGFTELKEKELWSTFKKPKQRNKRKRTIRLFEKGGEQVFALHKDSDIGIQKKFQTIVHQNNHDDDYDTDEEQMAESIYYCVRQVVEGLNKEFPDEDSKQSGLFSHKDPWDESKNTKKKI